MFSHLLEIFIILTELPTVVSSLVQFTEPVYCLVCDDDDKRLKFSKAERFSELEVIARDYVTIHDVVSRPRENSHMHFQCQDSSFK